MSLADGARRLMFLPLDRCRSYPGIPTRFDSNVFEIGEAIHREGQLAPGEAVVYGKQYLVFEGRRRLLGCRFSRYRFGGPSRYWANVHENLDEVEIFTEVLARNTTATTLSLLEEIKYFLEVNMRFGRKMAVQIGVAAGRQADSVRNLLDVCDWIEPMLARLHRIQNRTLHRFTLKDLEHLSAYKNDDLLFHEIAAVAAARDMDPSELNSSEIDSLIGDHATWFGTEFPEFANMMTHIPSA